MTTMYDKDGKPVWVLTVTKEEIEHHLERELSDEDFKNIIDILDDDDAINNSIHSAILLWQEKNNAS